MSNLTSLGHEPASKAKSHLDRANDLLDEAKALLAAEAREPEAPVRGFWRPVSWPRILGSFLDERTVAYGSEEDLLRYDVNAEARIVWTPYVLKVGESVTVLGPLRSDVDPARCNGAEAGSWIGRLARYAAPLAAKIAGRVYWIARCDNGLEVLVLAVSEAAVFASLDRRGILPGEKPMVSSSHFWSATRVEDDAEVQGKFDKVLLDNGAEVPLSTLIEAQVRP